VAEVWQNPGMPTSLSVSTLPMPDEQLVAAIHEVVGHVPDVVHSDLRWRILEGNDLNSTPIEELEQTSSLAAILRQHGEVLRWAQLLFQVRGQPDQGSISFARQDIGAVEVTLNLPDTFNSDSEVKTQVAIAFHQVFGKYARSNILDLVHPLLSDFYNRREESLTRLEELQTRMLAEFATRRREIEEAAGREAAGKAEELAAAQSALADLRKQLEDREPTRARRELQESLSKSLQEASGAPWPSAAIESKRLPVKLAFAGLIAVCAAVMVWAAYRATSPVAGEPFWFSSLRLGVALAMVAGAVALFIRWQDRWAAGSAREEQRLKLLANDLQRANWLVEAMLEWRAANGSDIPQGVLQRLTERQELPKV
jgi:hypothetical protein